MKQVEKEFFLMPTLEILKKIIGMYIVSEVGGIKTGGEIIEAEAYLGEEDPGSFAYGGRKGKKAMPLYGEPGEIYVYLNYGMYYLLNIVTEKKGVAGAILVRGIRPEFGVEEMLKRRRKDNIKGLCDGPGKLTIALGIDTKLNGLKVYDKKSPLRLYYGKEYEISKLKFTGRIGITKGAELPYRAVLIE